MSVVPVTNWWLGQHNNLRRDRNFLFQGPLSVFNGNPGANQNRVFTWTMASSQIFITLACAGTWNPGPLWDDLLRHGSSVFLKTNLFSVL